ncbi:MAG: hypothetical protein EB120_11985, partial [Proteobacteria bacterium]|nr:hypothetical protein [Pseudomonadota bacterium]
MNWFKKIIGATILTSLFFIAPEQAQAEMCSSCGLYNTGGYNLYSFGQNLNSIASACAPVTVPIQVPVYLSNPTQYLFSFSSPTFTSSSPSYGWGGGCGTFTQSCGSCYDSVGLGGYGSYSGVNPVDIQLLNLITYQNGILNQLSNPVIPGLGTGPTYPNPYSPISPVGPSPFYPPVYPPVYPTDPYNPGNPITSLPIGLGTGPTSPVPYDNTIVPPSSNPLPYGGCDNITVMCPQPGIQTYTNPSPVTPGSTV